MNPGKIAYIAGNVVSDPEERKGTRIGDLVSFRLAVTASYPKDGAQYGDTDWFEVTVKNPGLGISVMNEIYRGAKVMAQGNIQEKLDSNGKTQLTMWADRVGLIEYLRREQAPQQAAAPAAAPTDELGF